MTKINSLMWGDIEVPTPIGTSYKHNLITTQINLTIDNLNTFKSI